MFGRVVDACGGTGQRGTSGEEGGVFVSPTKPQSTVCWRRRGFWPAPQGFREMNGPRSWCCTISAIGQSLQRLRWCACDQVRGFRRSGGDAAGRKSGRRGASRIATGLIVVCRLLEPLQPERSSGRQAAEGVKQFRDPRQGEHFGGKQFHHPGPPAQIWAEQGFRDRRCSPTSRPTALRTAR